MVLQTGILFIVSLETSARFWFEIEIVYKSSAEGRKGAITIQRCSIENQKGTIAIDIVQP